MFSQDPSATPPAGDSAGAATSATAAAVTPDAQTAAILAKHQAGGKLTPSEGGLLGAFKKKLKAVTGGAASATPQTARPVVASPAATAQAPGPVLAAVPPDPDLVKRTTASVLDSINQIGSRKIVTAAKAVKADNETLARVAGAKVYGEDRKTLIVNTSPEAFAAMGIENGKVFALSVFFGNLALGALDFWQAVDELKDIERRNQAKPEPVPIVTRPEPLTPGTPPKPGDE